VTAVSTGDITTHKPLNKNKSEDPNSPDSVLEKGPQEVRRSRRIAEKTKTKKELENKLNDAQKTIVGSDKKSKDAKEQKKKLEEKQQKLDVDVQTARQQEGKQKPASNVLPNGDLSSETERTKNATQRQPAAITEENIKILKTNINLGESSGAVQSSEQTQFKRIEPVEEQEKELTELHSLRKALEKKAQEHKEELQRKDKEIKELQNEAEKYKKEIELRNSLIVKLHDDGAKVISWKNRIIEHYKAIIQQNQDAAQVPNRTDAESQSSSACSTKAPPSNPEN
jgi:DNA repair exonuclease SbcCD ATPase subunit